MPCLTEDQVVAYLQRDLPPDAAARVEAHVDQCPECRGLLVDLVEHSVLPTELSPPEAAPEVALRGEVLHPGSMVEHFKVLRLLGRGGMGEVYLCRDTRLGRKVALKVVRPERVGSREVVDRFLLEARTTARFNHPHIVTIHAVGEHEGLPYLALEYLEGQTLRQRMDEGRPGLREAMRIGLAVAQALEEAHRHHVLHRDLKPTNVLIPRDGQLRVLDFGLAKAIESPEPARAPLPPLEASTDTALAPLPEAERSVGIHGTPAYMAPEQWLEEKTTGATDVWALGMILYELVGGRLPYVEASFLTLRARVISPQPVPALESLDDLPPALVGLITRCLEKDPARRPAASEAAGALKALLSPAGHRSPTEEQSPFRGLSPFIEADADLFFGRDAEILAFLERLRHHGVLAVVGPSGSGKSSFVEAGVIPRLREQGPWSILRMRPGAHPFRSLAARLQQGERTPFATPTSQSLKNAEERDLLARRLEESPPLLGWLLQQRAEQERGRVLLFVDQLEELYAQVPEEATRRAFMQALCAAAGEVQDPVRVVFTLRDDFLGRLARGAGVRDALEQVTVVHTPDPEMMGDMLRRPLELLGYGFEDPQLAEEMLATIQGEPAGLSLLQFAAQMLWDRRDTARRVLTLQAYGAMGGVAGALALHADGVVGGLSPSEVRLARGLLLRLVTPDRTRRMLPRAQLLEGLGPGADEILERLTHGRLVTVRKGESESGAEAELAHESLIAAWSRLSRWMEESREEIAFLSEVGQAAELWQRRGERPDEIWRGEALAEALRRAGRCLTPLPGVVARFLSRGQAEEEHTLRLAKRRRALTTLFLALVALIAAGVALSFARQKQTVTREKENALRQRAEALREGASAALERGELLEARAKLRTSLESQDSTLGRALLWRLNQEPQIWGKRLDSVVYDLAFSPDGRTVAVASQDRSVYLFDTRDLSVRTLRGHDDQVFSVAFSSDGKRVASGSWDGQVRLWDLQAHTAKVLRGHTAAVWRLSFSPDGRQLASGSWDKTVRLWDLAQGSSSLVLTGHTAQVYGVAYRADGKLLASASADQTIRLWDAPSGKIVRTLTGHAGRVYSVAFSPDGKTLASGSADKSILLWDLERGGQRPLKGHTSGVYHLAWMPDGKTVASAGWDSTIHLWRVEDGKPTLLGHHGAGLYSLAVSRDGKLLASGGVDKIVRLWKPAVGGARQRSRVAHEAEAWGVAFSPDGGVLASGAADRTIRLWEVATGAQVGLLHGHADLVNGLSFSPDGKLLASGSADKSVRIWTVDGRVERHTLLGHTSAVHGIAFSPDGRSLASASADQTVRIWDVARGALRQTLAGHAAAAWDVAFSPDGKILASSSADGTIRLWEARTGEEKKVLRGHGAAVYGVAFSPDGQRLASASDDGTCRQWEVESGESRVLGHTGGRLYFLAYHPQGQWVAAPGSDGLVHLWNTHTGEQQALRGHHAEVNVVAFSPDGRLLASAADDGTVRVWRTDLRVPFWRAPLLLLSPPRLLTHRGWIALDGSAPDARGATWQRTVEAEALSASATRGGLLCLETNNHRLQLWDMRLDRRLFEEQVPDLHAVLAVGERCVVLARDQVRVYTRAGAFRELSSDARAMAVDRERRQVLVAAGDQVQVFDEAGELRSTHHAGLKVSALGRVGDQLVLGFGDGSLEILALSGGPGRRSHAFEGRPARPVTSILEGPMETVVAGYANGLLGIWDTRNGSLLLEDHLHGPVVHLLVQGRKLYAATELGDYRVIDLEVLYDDYCNLLRKLWPAAPVIWESGLPVLRPPPADHPCRRVGEGGPLVPR
jgi:WD40 repeat protein/serine/threonine protein kinase